MSKKGISNGVRYDEVPCLCGKHFGVGTWPAATRAEYYKRMVAIGVFLEEDKATWLASYQAEHEFNQ